MYVNWGGENFGPHLGPDMLKMGLRNEGSHLTLFWVTGILQTKKTLPQ